MPKNLIPPIPKTEEVRELTDFQEKKELNKKFILNNLSKYIVDIHGNFRHVDPETKKSDYYYIDKNLVHEYDGIIMKIAIMIINVKDDEDNWIWEIKEDGNYCNKEDGRIMFAGAFSTEQNERIRKALSEKVDKKVSELARLLENRGKERDRRSSGKWVSLTKNKNS
jgi:hypothetical protein